MKAKDRIKRYGLKAYIKTCLHKEPTPELIAKYQEKYGKVPIEKPIRYQQTFWNITYQDESSGAIEEIKNVSSKAHKIPNDERDLQEAINNGQYKLGGSNWKAIRWEKVGKRYIYHEEKERKPERKEKERKIISAEQIAEIAKGLKMAGLSAEEIGRAIKEILK